MARREQESERRSSKKLRMSLRFARALPAAMLLLALLAVPGLPASAAPVTSVHYVPTQLPDGTTEFIRVEIRRESKFDDEGQGVLGTMSPYNLTPTGTGVGAGMSNKGIAQAQIDVLGTRGSTGCWDYGGYNEMKAGVDAVRFLAGDIPDRDGVLLDWANGRVGLTGVSYDGTTANMVAAAPRAMWVDDRADSIDDDGTTPLKAIVPVAAISRWYGYAYAFGLRMTDDGESLSPADEDILTPLAFDLGFGLTVHTDQPVAAAQRGCGTVEHTQEAYTRNPDYDEFWLERDYTVTAKDWTTNALIVHGWNDYNVKQFEGIKLYEALAPFADDPTTRADDHEGRFDLRLWMTQSRHANGNGDGYITLRDNFLRAHLLEGREAKAAQRVVDGFPHVRSLGETTGGQAQVTFSETWPLEGTGTHSLFLNRTYEQDLDCTPVCIPGPGTGEVGELSYTNRFEGPLAGRSGSYGRTSGWLDTGLTGEEIATNDPWSNDGQKLDKLGGQGYYSLAFSTTPLTRDVQIAGSAVLEGYYNFIAANGAGLTPILVDIAPNDDYKVIERGFLNTDYRNGLAASAGTASGWVRADVTFFPEDYTVPEGHRIGVIVTSSNSVWTIPGNPAGFVSVGLGPGLRGLQTETGTVLHLPLVDVAPGERVFVDWPSPE
jgi:X-Pro dipeptidyl-peptidase